MRWQLDFNGRFERYVDADEMRTGPHGGREFVRHTSDGTGFVVVCTISHDVAPYVRVSYVPTFRMVGGPKDGQVAPAPEKVPERIYFQAVVALGEDGETLAPVPGTRLRELTDVYVHHPLDCACHGTMRGLVEHTYVWPETLHEQMAMQGVANPVAASGYPSGIPRDDQDADGARCPHRPGDGVSPQSVRPAAHPGLDAAR